MMPFPIASAPCLELSDLFATATRKLFSSNLHPRGHRKVSCRFSAGVLAMALSPLRGRPSVRLNAITRWTDLSGDSDFAAFQSL
jgi:hypothetical protein